MTDDIGDTIKGVAEHVSDRGWVLGFVLVVAIIVLSDTYKSIKLFEAQQAEDEIVSTHFHNIETNRAEELRRAQETIKALAETLARSTERRKEEPLK